MDYKFNIKESGSLRGNEQFTLNENEQIAWKKTNKLQETNNWFLPF